MNRTDTQIHRSRALVLGLTLALTGALCLACSDESGPEAGTEGGACYPNGTCNAGLSCFSNLCVRAQPGDAKVSPDHGNDHDMGPADGPVALEGSTPTPDKGPAPDTKPRPCTGNAQCDDKLSCTDDVCTASGCKNTLKSNQCLISGTCYQHNAAQTGNTCLRCVPNQSTQSFTLVAAKGCVTTFAGTGTAGYKDGKFNQAQLFGPTGMARDAAGALYIADRKNNRIRKLSGGVMSTLAGTGAQGSTDGPVAAASFNWPKAVAVDSAGAVYVADYGNHKVRRIAGGTVTTVGGSGVQGFADGPVASSKLSYPSGVAVAAPGKIYVADRANHRIRLIAGGTVSTFAGQGSAGHKDGPAASALFRTPTGVAVDGAGNVYVADSGNNRIRVISAGKVTTLAGDGGAGLVNGGLASARFNAPEAITVDPSGVIFVADTKNHVVRRIATGQVSTAAGAGQVGFLNGPAASARFNQPTGMAVDAQGHLYLADPGNHRVRLLTY